MTDYPPPLYLSPTSAPQVLANLDVFGFLQSPRTGLRAHIQAGAWWAMDNDCFNTGGQLDKPAWERALRLHHPYRDRCLFILAPDVPYDAAATLMQFEYYAEILHAAGFPVALATQNGMTPATVPWGQVDALFIAGDDEHKLGAEGAALIRAAQELGVWVHVGRVNSRKRLLRFRSADSWDGTCVAIEPQQAIKIARTVREIRVLNQTGGLDGLREYVFTGCSVG